MSANQPMPENPKSPTTPWPGVVRWLCAFQVTNGINFIIVLGAPMVLIGKYLGAGDALIGLILALTPFLCVLQVLAARLADAWGYQRLMLAWSGLRSLLLLLMIPLPLLRGQSILGWPVPDGWLLAMLLILVFLYTALRNVIFVGWVPWLSKLIPETQRGRYFGWDQTCVSAGMLASLIFSAVFLGNDQEGVPGWKYALLLLIAWLAFELGRRLLRIVPCPPPAAPSATSASFGWREFLAVSRQVWAHKPFRRMVRWMIINNLAWGAYGGFTVVFMRDELKISEGHALGISAATMLGIIASSMFWGKVSDHVGSRPIMRLAGAGQVCVLTCWLLLAAGMLHLSVGGLYLLNLCFGVITAAMTIPFLKLYMESFPKDNLTSATTLNTAIASVFSGISPLAWGAILQLLKAQPALENGWLRPFTIFFGISIILTLLIQVALGRIRDDKAMSHLELLGTLMIDWPRQLISGLVDSIFGPRPQP